MYDMKPDCPTKTAKPNKMLTKGNNGNGKMLICVNKKSENPNTNNSNGNYRTCANVDGMIRKVPIPELATVQYGQRIAHKDLRRSKSRELRAGIMFTGCDCERRNGMQDQCQRTGCHGSPACLTKPEPSCGPSEFSLGKHLEKKRWAMEWNRRAALQESSVKARKMVGYTVDDRVGPLGKPTYGVGSSTGPMCDNYMMPDGGKQPQLERQNVIDDYYCIEVETNARCPTEIPCPAADMRSRPMPRGRDMPMCSIGHDGCPYCYIGACKGYQGE